VHLVRWPAERAVLAEIAGRVLASVLAGRPECRRVRDADGVRDTLTVAAVPEEDERGSPRCCATTATGACGSTSIPSGSGRSRGEADTQAAALMPLAPTG
jgi:hypothetical protein